MIRGRARGPLRELPPDPQRHSYEEAREEVVHVRAALGHRGGRRLPRRKEHRLPRPRPPARPGPPASWSRRGPGRRQRHRPHLPRSASPARAKVRRKFKIVQRGEAVGQGRPAHRLRRRPRRGGPPGQAARRPARPGQPQGRPRPRSWSRTRTPTRSPRSTPRRCETSTTTSPTYIPYPLVEVGLNRMVREAKVPYLLGALAVIPIALLLTTIRWHLLLEAVGIHIGMGQHVRHQHGRAVLQHLHARQHRRRPGQGLVRLQAHRRTAPGR